MLLLHQIIYHKLKGLTKTQPYTDVEHFVFQEDKTSISWSDIFCINLEIELELII